MTHCQEKGIIRRQMKLRPADIALFQFILEGYEGLATVTTIDRFEARIEMAVMPDFMEDLSGILKSMREDPGFEEVPGSGISTV